MAITIEQAPNKRQPAYNDLVFVVSSTNSGNTNFKYVVDVVINGATTRMTLFPHPSFGTAYVNIGKIVETYVTSDISIDNYGFQPCPNSNVAYQVRFGEQYGEPVVVYPDLNNTTGYFVWNAVMDFLFFQSYPNVTPIPAPKRPSNVIIRDAENAWLYTTILTSGSIGFAEVITMDSAGATIQTVQVQNPFSDSDANDSKTMRFGCGTSNMNLIPSSGISLGSQPIITASVASYSVELKQLSGAQLRAPQTYTINNVCTKNNLYRIHFMNEDGGFDSFTFYRADSKSVSINRSSYRKNAAGLTSADTYGYETKSRTTIAYNTKLKDRISVLSDWITGDESIWLEELITSPEVYLDDATYGLVSINVNSTSYDIKQTETEKLFNLRLTFTYSYDRFRQRY